MSYGFKETGVQLPVQSQPASIQLPKQAEPREALAKPAAAPAMSQVLQAGAALGFVSRETNNRRKPGPRRTEAQDKISVTGPKRIIDRLKAYSDAMGGISYCEAIEVLLEAVEAKGN